MKFIKSPDKLRFKFVRVIQINIDSDTVAFTKLTTNVVQIWIEEF